MTETVRAGNLITLHYRVATGDDTELVSTFDSTPATLQLGSGELAPTLEHCLIGVAVGERHVFLLESWQAFGDSQPDLIHTLPKADLPADIQLEVDQLVEFAMPSGQTLAGHILEIGDTAVKVDFNHPLADLSIEFEVEIVRIL